MANRFERFIEVILKHEGGYVNDPDDAGGETKYGITKRRYPYVDIKKLTIEQAKAIYYEDFYLAMKLQYIENDLLALHVFDMGVNAGKKTAVKLLQELILFPEDVDGLLGPRTARAIKQASPYVDLAAAYKARRVERYYYVSTLRRNSKFLKGWINRVNGTKL